MFNKCLSTNFEAFVPCMILCILPLVFYWNCFSKKVTFDVCGEKRNVTKGFLGPFAGRAKTVGKVIQHISVTLGLLWCLCSGKRKPLCRPFPPHPHTAPPLNTLGQIWMLVLLGCRSDFLLSGQWSWFCGNFIIYKAKKNQWEEGQAGRWSRSNNILVLTCSGSPLHTCPPQPLSDGALWLQRKSTRYWSRETEGRGFWNRKQATNLWIHLLSASWLSHAQSPRARHRYLSGNNILSCLVFHLSALHHCSVPPLHCSRV